MAAQTVGANVRRLRRTRGLSLVDLGQHAGLAKGTLTQLEAGRGNPTIDTLQALSRALGVTLGELVAEPPETAPRVVRADDGPLVPDWELEARLIQRTHIGSAIIELYGMRLQADGVHHSPAHAPGVLEQLYVLDGTLEAGPEDATVTLRPHYFARYSADEPHRYAAVDGPVRALMLMLFPALPAGSPVPAAAPPRRLVKPAAARPAAAPPRPTPPQVPARGVRPPSRNPPGGVRRPPGSGS